MGSIGLCRFDFIEVLIRVAVDKYFRKGKAASPAEAFRLLVERNLRLASRGHVWGRFRAEKIHTHAVADLLAANLDLLATIYEQILPEDFLPPQMSPMKRIEDTEESVESPESPTKASRISTVSMQTAKNMLESKKKEPMLYRGQAIALFDEYVNTEISAEQVRYAYGLSKMTVADESGAEHWNYDRMPFVEFLEYVCRIGHLTYEGTQMEAIELSKKVETVMD